MGFWLSGTVAAGGGDNLQLPPYHRRSGSCIFGHWASPTRRGSRPRFSIAVEGQPRLLRPLIKAEAYRIGREALVNAFRHSEASRVELYLQYAPAGLSIAVCDDGKGISAESLHAGCSGLSWMRERAEHMGAKLKVLSHAAGGTEIQIFVPRVIAFECQG